MAEPLRSRLRPARRSGLTSPDPGPHPSMPARAHRPPAPDPGPRTNRRTVTGRKTTPSKPSPTKTANAK
jgi:hypothetical protein